MGFTFILIIPVLKMHSFFSTSDHNPVHQRPVGVSNNGPFGMGAGRGRAMSSPSIVHQALGHVNGELSGADHNIKSSTGME